MDLAEKIDPSEVLAHLNQLGYENISPQQLREFIRDLKKLIAYDQLSSSSGSLTSISSSAASHFSHSYTSETSADQSKPLRQGCSLQKSQNESVLTQSSNRTMRHHNAFKSTSINSGHMLKRGFSSSSSCILDKCPLKENVPIRQAKTKSMCEDDLQEAVKPKTSFIRPWQLQGAGSGLGRMGRSDPVSLYHHYQTLWAQRKCPGEDSHADLRWVIREKMLGQDPHLYSQNVQSTGRKNTRFRI